MSTSDLTSALGDFFEATWPTDQPVEEPGAWSDTGWSAFAELGLHLVGVDEDAGGSGGTFADVMALATLAGRHTVDVPVTESTTAAWAVTEAGLPLSLDASYSLPTRSPDLTVHDDGSVSGTLPDVPWGASIDLVVAVAADGRTVVVAPGVATVRPGLDLSGQPRDTLVLDHARPQELGTGVTAQALRDRAAALRVAMTAGTLQAMAELTRRYAGERVQFGKPIGAFQAVQAHIVELQQMAAMTTALAERLSLGSRLHAFDVLAAQLVSLENAQVAARAAHQAHGAIGMTREYRLQGYTRRLHAWSGDFGEAIDLASRLGAIAADAPSFAHLILDDHHRPEVLP